MKQQKKGKRPNVSEPRLPASKGLAHNEQPTSNPFCEEVIPIHHGGQEIGTVHFAFTYSKEISDRSKSETLTYPEELLRVANFLRMIGLLSYIRKYIKEDLEIGLNGPFREEGRHAYHTIVYYYYHPNAFDREEERISSDAVAVKWKLKFSPYTINERGIFEEISKVGPVALRQGHIQDALISWLGDKEMASEKMGKLRTSLLKYSLGSIDKPFKPGRPKTRALQTSSEPWIKDMYKEISEVLKIAKQRAISLKKDLSGKSLTDQKKSLISELQQRTDEPHLTAADAKRILKSKTVGRMKVMYEGPVLYAFVNDAYGEYLTKLEERYLNSTDSTEARKLRDRADRLGNLRNTLAIIGNPISDALMHNHDLEEEFGKLKFEPNRLAKEIVGELLGLSLSKLQKIIY